MDALEPQVKYRRTGAGIVTAFLTVGVLSRGSVEGQTVSAPELKAAFLYNLALFAEWPADVMPAGIPVVMCIDNDRSVADALERTSRGRSVQGREVIVRYLDEGAPVAGCHQLYIGGTDLKRSLAVIRTVKSAGVFTVSTAARFANSGGIAELFLDDDRMRIAVNINALQRARVRLSSRVLELAKIVTDAPAQ